MNFKKRWKKDKRFRTNVSIVGIFILILFFSQPQQQAVSQADCEAENSVIGAVFGIKEASDVTKCTNLGCAIQIIPSATSILPWFSISKYPYCTLKVPIGGVTNDADGCIDTATRIEFPEKVNKCGSWFNDCFECTEGSEGEITQCASWQKPFAGILDSVCKKNDIDDCSTKAYIVMGAVGLVAMAVI